MALAGLAILIAAVADIDPAWAQTSGILAPGNAIVTGFSGAPPPAQIAPGQDPGDVTFIDPSGPSAKVFNLQSPGAPPQAQVIPAPNPFTVTAAQVGQVFGVAIDNATPPNMYVAASSAYGLPIVVPGANGAPMRVHQGAPGATFMAGLFGPPAQGSLLSGLFGGAQAGGPGSIWRIDGVTGAVTLFANVTLNGAPNSGPALGGLAFDAASGLLFVADRQTGMIQSFNLRGVQVGSYDHGVQGLTAAGQPPVPYTPSALDITNPAFSSDNPASWDYAPPQRLIFGLGVQGGRLYYGLAAGLQVWSVSINSAGTFGSDARMEVQVPPAQGPTEISKIIFDGSGDMILAERGTPTGDYELMAVAQPAIGRALRYSPVPATPSTPGGWQPTPDQYAIGFAGQYTNDNGGAAIGYNYNVNGALDPTSCGGFLWSTGEQLRNSADPNIAAQLATTGVLDLNGLQGNALSLVMPANVPPAATYFVDYAAALDDPAAAGHLGDIAIPIKCSQAAGPPAGYCPPYRMTPFGRCCPSWQVVDNGQCMCPGGLQPGQGGQCSCQAGYSQQPGYLCCPFYTLPGARGQCQTTCKDASKSDPLSEKLCFWGYSPEQMNGNLVCADGNPPAGGSISFPPPNSIGGGIPEYACANQSAFANPANCPASWTIQPPPANAGPTPANARVCQPPAQCANAVGDEGSQLGLDGKCDILCGSPTGGYAYAATQCCPTGVTAGPNGICPPSPPQTCTSGSTYHCPPVAPVVGAHCDDNDRVPGGCCAAGSKPMDGQCIPTSCTGGGTCCSANVVVDFRTYPPSCCKPGEIVLLGGACGPPRTPPHCPSGDTVFCKPVAPPIGAACAPGTQLPDHSCCPSGTKVDGDACVATGNSCPAGDEQRCCKRDETANYIKGGCCPRDEKPNSDGVCKPPPPPPRPPTCERPGTTPFCQPSLTAVCQLGQSVNGGTGCCPAGSSPNQADTGCAATGPTCGAGTSSTAPVCCPATTPLQSNGQCGTPPAAPSAPPPAPSITVPIIPPVTGCFAGYAIVGTSCVRVPTLPGPPPIGTTTTTPGTPSCIGGEVRDGKCKCATGEPRDGRCPPAPTGGSTTTTPGTPSCIGGQVVGTECKCTTGEPRDGRCPPAPTGGSTTTTPGTPSCIGGQVVGTECKCTTGEPRDGRCPPATSGGSTTAPVNCTGGQVDVGGHCECRGGEEFKDGRCVASGESTTTKTNEPTVKPPVTILKPPTTLKTVNPPKLKTVTPPKLKITPKSGGNSKNDNTR